MSHQKTLAELRKKPHWSYSSLNQFLNVCSLQWAWRHVYHAEPEFTPLNLVFGGVFHKTLEFAFRHKLDGGTIPEAQVGQLFRDLWAQTCQQTQPTIRFPDGTSPGMFDLLGPRMLQAYFAALDPAEQVVAVSQTFSVPLVDAEGEELETPVIGEFDCVVENERGRFIVDWKSASRKWPAAKSRQELQPTIYLHAIRAQGDGNARFRYDVVTKVKAPAVEFLETNRDPDACVRLTEAVKVVEKMTRAELFLPNDQSFACSDCPHGLACQAWHRNQARGHYRLEWAA